MITQVVFYFLYFFAFLVGYILCVERTEALVEVRRASGRRAELVYVLSTKPNLLCLLLVRCMLPRTAILPLADETRLESVGIRVRVVVAVAVAVRTISTTSASRVAWSVLRKISSVGVIGLGVDLLFLLVRRNGRLKLVDKRAKAYWWI